jgi:class 3 adenylate cyclase
MLYDGLQASYWHAQQQRIEALRAKISQRHQAGEGRVVPDDNSLTLGDGRRLKMAIMFLDISGFSSRSMETAEEQDLTLRVLNLFFTELIRIAEEYGGNVEKNTGDGLMVYFKDNEGTPLERGVKRGVACALTMFAATLSLINPILRATPTPEIQFRVSMDYGNVTIARLGPPRRFNSNVAVGTTANVASKLLTLASPGDIVLGELARNELPVVWQKHWTRLIPENTGWVYRSTGHHYPAYRYIGRWSRIV